MPREFRDIVFSNDEVVAAWSAYDLLQSDQVICCDAADLSMAQKDGTFVVLHVYSEQADG